MNIGKWKIRKIWNASWQMYIRNDDKFKRIIQIPGTNYSWDRFKFYNSM